MPHGTQPASRPPHGPAPAGPEDREPAELTDELLDAFERVVRRRSFILGEEVSRFEETWAAACSMAERVASGTAALSISLQAARIGAGDEVSVPAHEDATPAHAAERDGRRAGAETGGATLRADPALGPRPGGLAPAGLGYAPSRASKEVIHALTRSGVAATTAAPTTSVPVA